MSSTLPDIAMLWDGQTPEAELHVSGNVLYGTPSDVKEAFHVLNRLLSEARRQEEALKAFGGLLVKGEQILKREGLRP